MSALSKVRSSQKDLVIGIGATGLSIARYLRKQGRNACFFDTRAEPPGLKDLCDLWGDVELYVGAMKLPQDIDRLIVSPGVEDRHSLLAAARDAGLEVISDIELFTREVAAPFVAVTGSNGKSTVTTLIYHMCCASGRKALAGGNLGVPALDLLDEEVPDVYVLELSSFQLQRTVSLPAEVAVLLNVSPDHLDWHADEDEYRESKYRIFREAKSAVVNRADDSALEKASRVETVISFGLDEPEEEQYGIRREEDRAFLARGGSLLLAVSELALYGSHNHANALAALAAGELLGLDLSAMLAVLCEFPGLAHRMQLVRRIGDVDYVNDSKATNVAAAAASISSVEGMIVLIAGGDGKGADFTGLAAPLDNKLRAAVLIGRDADTIATALDTVMPIVFAGDMDDAVQQAAELAEPGDTVLLAPACASFDQFDNYMARGDAFADAVEALAR